MKKELVGCFDCPDRRDWTPDKMFGGDIPDDIYEKDIDMINIRTRKQTVNNCTSQALVNVILIMLRIGKLEDQNDNLVDNLDGDPTELWERQKIKVDGTWGTATQTGDYLQNCLKTAKVLGVPILIGTKWINVKIKSYARITNSEVDTYMRKGYPVYTGFDWFMKDGKSYDGNGIILDENSEAKSVGGHCIAIPVKTETQYKLLNSHGEKWGHFKNGTAGVYRDQLEDSYSKYIINLDFEQIKKRFNSIKHEKI